MSFYNIEISLTLFNVIRKSAYPISNLSIYGSDVNIIESIWEPGVFLSKQIQFVKTNTTHKVEQPNFLITVTVYREFTIPEIVLRHLISL